MLYSELENYCLEFKNYTFWSLKIKTTALCILKGAIVIYLLKIVKFAGNFVFQHFKQNIWIYFYFFSLFMILRFILFIGNILLMWLVI